MKIRYKNLSYGYIGKKHNEATLNAKYYAEFLRIVKTSPHLLANLMPFPQRIPRTGFLKELYALETTVFKHSFVDTLDFFKNQFKNANDQLNDRYNEKNIRVFINWINILLRYGEFDEIKNQCSQNFNGQFALEVNILKETTHLESCLSNDSPIDISNFVALTHVYLDKAGTTDREKIMLLNRIIVYFCRYQNNKANEEIVKFSEKLIEILKNFKQNDFISKLCAAVAYRGLAMVSDFTIEAQAKLLLEAEEISRSLTGLTLLETIVASENLYTLLQTMSKWHLLRNNLNAAEKYLHEMIVIDPFDSTGHSELGFFYLKTQQYNQAAQYFQNAMRLGPPSPSMNTYYLAKCLEKIGKQTECILYLYESAALDNQALSPWLDLFICFKEKGNTKKASKIAKHIYHTPVLKEQLETDEIKHIQAYID